MMIINLIISMILIMMMMLNIIMVLEMIKTIIITRVIRMIRIIRIIRIVKIIRMIKMIRIKRIIKTIRMIRIIKMIRMIKIIKKIRMIKMIKIFLVKFGLVSNILSRIHMKKHSFKKILMKMIKLTCLQNIKFLVNYCIHKKLQSPIFPGGMPGITIGIGYDLGQCSIKQFQQNWKNKLAQDHYKMLEKCIGLKGEKAKMFLNQNKKDLSLIKIPIKTAKQVLNNKLQYYQKTIQKNYPKLKQKYPNTYNSLVCMHYNRGFNKKGQSRKQIILIDQVLSGKKQTNLPIPEFVAKQILSMCRLWQKDKNLKGLINRRHQQAENCMKDIKMKK